MLKKPWICPAWRSTETTRLTPEVWMRSATSLRRDGRARRDLAVLPAVAVVRDDGRDRAGRRAPERVGHDEELHHVVVRRAAGRLDDERVDAADVLADLDEALAVAEARHLALAERASRGTAPMAAASSGLALPEKRQTFLNTRRPPPREHSRRERGLSLACRVTRCQRMRSVPASNLGRLSTVKRTGSARCPCALEPTGWAAGYRSR